MDTKGKHLIFDLYECNGASLNDERYLLETCREAAKLAGATILEAHSHIFEPQGVSVVIILQESHLSLHSFPEEMYASLDLYTCGEKTEPMMAYDFLVASLGSKHATCINIIRGVREKA